MDIDVPFWIIGLICLVVAAAFAIVWPRETAASGIQFLILRWGHTLVWLLLAVSFFLRQASSDLANPVAALGGLTYAAFLFTLLGNG